jgi:putative glutamine amidotransferase
VADRPLIGISAYDEQARWAVWDTPATLLPRAYVDRVHAAGGLPVVLPALPEEDAARYVDRLDGLLLAGGGDLDPALYGAGPHPATRRVSAARDRAERGLLAAALGTGLPVLGVCRGLQLLNVHLGGTLHQHVPDLLGGATTHSPAPGVYGRHPVTLDAGSRVAELHGRTDLEVTTSHHQAVARVGDGLLVTGRAPDGTVEAAEFPDRPFVVAVQWHPEQDGDLSLFTGLVDAARAGSAAPGSRLTTGPVTVA